MAIRAVADLRGWRLVVVGSGPDLPRLRRLVRRLGITDRVDFIAWAPRNDLHRLMRRSDVVVVPSLRDDSPFVVAEAQALGLPVAGFDQGGLATFARLEGASIALADLTGSRLQATRNLRDAIMRASATKTQPTGDAFSVDDIVMNLRGIYAAATASTS